MRGLNFLGLEDKDGILYLCSRDKSLVIGTLRWSTSSTYIYTSRLARGTDIMIDSIGEVRGRICMG